MKRTSVNRYYLTVSIYDTITTKLRITREQYDQQLKELSMQTDEHAYDECPATHSYRTYAKEGLTVTVHTFSCTTSDILLEQHHCHDGYQFVSTKSKPRK